MPQVGLESLGRQALEPGHGAQGGHLWVLRVVHKWLGDVQALALIPRAPHEVGGVVAPKEAELRLPHDHVPGWMGGARV